MDQSRSREAVLEFLDYCKNKGLMKTPTAEARKAAVNQVLGILSDSEAADVSKVDVDAVMHRFQNLHGSRYNPDSLRTYRARVRNSIADFLRFRENPMDFRTSAGSTSKKLAKPKSNQELKPVSNRSEPPHQASSPPFFTTSTLPIAIRQDLTVLIHGLPFDLTEGEARKIANVVLALAAVPPQ